MDMAAQYVVRLRQEAAEALQATAGDRTATQQQQLEAALSLLGETQEAAVAGLEVRRRWPCPHAPTPVLTPCLVLCTDGAGQLV